MDTRLAQFVRGLYFDIQTIEGVQTLEIWSGLRERDDPFEMARLVKNLYKIVVPLVNERCFGKPFSLHSRRAKATVTALIDWFGDNPESGLFERFPYPPTGDVDQKELYRLIKSKADILLAESEPDRPRGTREGRDRAATDQEVFPDGLFDFREMRLVDNELPYIIFTDKEFRVIHGLAIVYLWLIDLDTIFLETLEEQGVDTALREEYRQFGRRVHRENPLIIHGRRMDAKELLTHIHEKLKYEDYLDLFENVYAWFEHTRDRLAVQE
jgi:hypothetical protein